MSPISEFDQRPATLGDVVFLASNTLCGGEPEGHVTVTTVYLDTDYNIDQVFWQYAAVLSGRLHAQQFVETFYSEAAQLIHLGEDRAGILMPWLDELFGLTTIENRPMDTFYRVQTLLFSVVHVLTSFVKTTPIREPSTQRETTWPTQPRRRGFLPLQTEVRRVAELVAGELETPLAGDRLRQRDASVEVAAWPCVRGCVRETGISRRRPSSQRLPLRSQTAQAGPEATAPQPGACNARAHVRASSRAVVLVPFIHREAG